MAITRNAVKRQKQAIVDRTIFDNDILLGIAPFLESSDLANLAITCRSLGSKQLNHGSDWSLVEDVSMQVVIESQTNEERDVLPRYDGESWITILHQLELLRSPLAFDLLIGDRIDYVEEDLSCVTSSNPRPGNLLLDLTGTPQTAICSNQIMRSGKHYATFELTGCGGCIYFYTGIIRPMRKFWGNTGLKQFFPCVCPSFEAFSSLLLEEDTGDRWGESNVHCCTYFNYEGTCSWTDWREPDDENQSDVDWSGMEGTDIEDGTVGMLLDLDEGTLSVYLNGRRLGVMMRGLAGEYCWMATVIAQFGGQPHEQNVSVKRGRLPAGTH